MLSNAALNHLPITRVPEVSSSLEEGSSYKCLLPWPTLSILPEISIGTKVHVEG